jgi:hypothetical protein
MIDNTKYLMQFEMKNNFCHIVYTKIYTHGFFNLMVHNILQSDLHGFKAFVLNNLTIIFVPPMWLQ